MKKKILDNFGGRQFPLAKMMKLTVSGQNRPLKLFKAKFREITRYDLRLSKNGYASMPHSIVFQPSFRCNLRCKGCTFYGESGICLSSERNMKQSELSLSEVRDFFTEIAPSVPVVIFTGGEPFIRKDTIDMIEFAKSKKMFCSVITNGTLLDEGIIRRLLKAKLDVIIFSIDGVENIHDDVRGVSGTYRRVINNLELISRLKKEMGVVYPLVQINHTIFEQNYSRISDFAEHINSLKTIHPDILSFHYPMFLSHKQACVHRAVIKKRFGVDSDWIMGQVISSINIDPKILKEQKEIIMAAEKRYPFKVVFQPNLGDQADDYFKENYEPKGKICYRTWCQPSIEPDGRVQFCSDVYIGNVKDNFKKVWNGEKARDFRLVLKKGLFPGCKRCCYLTY
ncbi:MAG TPA: radical SAM protein [bacterium]|nr:radical SAM protein [bacterium]